jgi:hypothetical protein
LRKLRWIAAIVLTLLVLGAAEGRAIDLPVSPSATGIDYAPVEYEPAPPSPLVGIKARGRRVKRGKPAQIVVWVSPCKAQRGRLVRLLRDGRPNGNRFVSRACTARFYPRVRRPTVFRAELMREEDGAFFVGSRQLTIKINRRR